MSEEIFAIPLQPKNENTTLKKWGGVVVQKIFSHTRSSLLIVFMSVFLVGLVIQGTQAYLDDQEKITDGQWMTGSLDVDVVFGREEVVDEIEDGGLDAEAPRLPTVFRVENIGSHPFFYTLKGSIPEGQPNRCQNVRVRLWKAGTRRAVYAGPVKDLNLSSVNDENLFLNSLDRQRWRYQLRYPGNTKNCEASLMVDARQGLDAGGFHDQASIVGQYDTQPLQALSTFQEAVTPTVIPIQTFTLAEQDGAYIQQMGSFLFGEVSAEPDTQGTFTLSYTRTVENLVTPESVTGVLDVGIFDNLLLPEQYIGHCRANETACAPFTQIKDMKLTIQLYQNENVIRTITLPLQWNEIP